MAALLNAVKTAEGVVVNGFVVSPIIDKCEGCDRIREFEGENRRCQGQPPEGVQARRQGSLDHTRHAGRARREHPAPIAIFWHIAQGRLSRQPPFCHLSAGASRPGRLQGKTA